MAFLHQAVKDAVGIGLVSRNVIASVTPPEAVRPPIKTWDVPDVQRFLAVAADDGYSPTWLIALHTSMRRGELLGLRWQDVDLQKGVLYVRRGITPAGAVLHVDEPKTATGRRTISLDSICVQALREFCRRQNEPRLLLGSAWRDLDLVFANDEGA